MSISDWPPSWSLDASEEHKIPVGMGGGVTISLVSRDQDGNPSNLRFHGIIGDYKQSMVNKTK